MWIRRQRRKRRRRGEETVRSFEEQSKREYDQAKERLFRVNFVYGVIALSCVGLILRVSYLQISKSSSLRVEALNSTVASIPVIPARGRIYDTNGVLLAYDEPVYNVYYTQIPNVNTSDMAISQLASVLARQFDTTPRAIAAKIWANREYSTVRLFAAISNEEVAFIGEHRGSLPGISLQVSEVRRYPYDCLAGQVLGYVGPITPPEQDEYVRKKHYQFNQIIGQSGVERQYEPYLQGRIGYQLQRLGRGNNGFEEGSYNPPPVAGNNLRLTLDSRLQADIQNVVWRAIASYERASHVQITDGAAVMMDLRTGGVLAMVSYPYLNPNWFITGAVQKHRHYLSASGAEQNNVIQNPHYPGSTVKPANLVAGLTHGVVTPDSVFNDTSLPLWIGDYPLREDASYGRVTPIRALAVSDDKFFYSLGLALGRWFGSSATNGGEPEGGFQNLQHWKETSFIRGILTMDLCEMSFGLGALTGIDLPWEQPGAFYISDSRMNPSPAVPLPVSKALHDLSTNGRYVNYGSPLDLAFTAFGQMQQFTPMQLVEYVATIASGGKRLKPHVLQEILPPGLARRLAKTTPVVARKSTVSQNVSLRKDYLQIAQEGMYAACNQPGGTAYVHFRNAPYKAAGKTGTAEIVMNGRKVNNSVFIGYAPYDHPQIAVAVMVPGAGFGATTAVPIARFMMDDYFKERHSEYFPKSQWTDPGVPKNWMTSPARTSPEHTP